MMWNAQDVYTDAMACARCALAMQQVLDDEAERSALNEALLQARLTDDRSLWEVAQLLRLPQKGPYVVIAAKCPTVGKQALPGIADMLRSVDIFFAWRLLPDLQTGIAHIPSDTEHVALLALLNRLATTRVGSARVRRSRRHRAGTAIRTCGRERPTHHQRRCHGV
jgi:hypothetical protein